MEWLIISTCTVNQEEQYFFFTNVVEAVREFFLFVCYMSVCTSSHTTRLGGLVLFARRLWGRSNDNHRGINLVSFGARNCSRTTILYWNFWPWEDSGDTRFFLRKSLINLNNVLLRFLIRRARDGIYYFLKFMTVGVTHGISKEIAHFTCQFVHETQIDIEIKQHLYWDIRESSEHFECEWLPQPCKLARQTHFADRRRIFKSLCLLDSLTCVIYSLSYTLTVVSGVQCH